VQRDPAAPVLERQRLVERLHASLETLEWALRMIPPAWTHRSPGGVMVPEQGAWSAAMNLAHLAMYEEQFPTVVLEDLLAGGNGLARGADFNEDRFASQAMALASEQMPTILGRLQRARSRQIDLAEQFSDAAFAAPATPAWGSSGMGPRRWSPARVLAKTLQHSWEHGNAILQVAVFAPVELVED
jgi:DinB family protein